MSDDDPPDVSGDAPEIDGRRRDLLAEDVREMVPYYVENWDPDEGDVGGTLLSLFAELAEEVTERLDRVPEKHRVAFYETLGFDRQPPQPATLPLTVEVADDAGENVTVPAGAVAKAEPPSGGERLFEVPGGEAFDATPANLQAVYSVRPHEDREDREDRGDAIYAHQDALSTGDETTLFEAGENLQEHVLHIGDAKRLSAGPGSTLVVTLDAEADPQRLHDRLQWEYYGERTVGEETVEGWHPFPGQVDGMVGLATTLAATATDGGWPNGGNEGGRAGGNVTAASLTMDRETTYRDFEVEYRKLYSGARTSATYGSSSTLRTGQGRTLAVDDSLLEALPKSYFGFDVDSRTPVWAELLAEKELRRTDEGKVRLEFVPNGTLTKTTVDGVESKWIRCRLPAGGPADLFELRFGRGAGDPPATVGTGADGLDPDKMLHNDVPLSAGPNDDIRPFGEHPRHHDTFYIASADALTKTGATVTITFTYAQKGGGGDSPVLSWEYFDGEGWSQIPKLPDNPSQFTDFKGDETVSFDVPPDLSKTTVAGHEGHWVRVRLVGGDYGQLRFEPDDTDDDGTPDRYEQKDDDIVPPSFEDVRLQFSQTKPPEHAVTKNNLGFESVPTTEGTYRPFEPVPVEEQTLFLGFDGPLTDGPINLLFDLEDVAYAPDFHPQVRWEYTDPRTGEWTRPDVLDGTEGLTERGIVGLVFPVATESTREFGRDRHWVRARVTDDSFGVSGTPGSGGTGRTRDGQACGRVVETVPPAGTPGRDPPTVRGLYPNTTWARNRRTVEGEILGSSDGSVDQAFSAANPPIIDPTVWVDELAVLSEGSRKALRERWPDRTEVETDDAGQPVAFWVRWERRADLLDSGPEERHFTVDSVVGTVSFGDGTRGKIPPRGTDNVRLSYATGGGAAGNVPAGTVSGFQQSLAYVDSVTNPRAGAAGADAEATNVVTDRAARQLRDRDRAVAPADVERIAMDASRRLARARCLPAMDRNGAYQPGWVTLLIVPESAARKPTPSATLRGDVEQAVAGKAPATPVGLDRLVVRGPSYVTTTVEAEVAATGGSISELEERAREAVRSYLHPLTGRAGDGWAFGELPCRSDFYGLLEGVDRVDHVEELSVTFRTDRSTVTVAEGETTPDTSPDALVHSGTHEVTASLADGGGE